MLLFEISRNMYVHTFKGLKQKTYQIKFNEPFIECKNKIRCFHRLHLLLFCIFLQNFLYFSTFIRYITFKLLKQAAKEKESHYYPC